MRTASSNSIAWMIAAALLLALSAVVAAQPAAGVLDDLKAARDLRVGELESAFSNDDSLCRQRAYQTALGQLEDLARQARRVAQAAAAAKQFSAVNAAEADAVASDLRAKVAKYQGQLADCERRSLADKALALDDAHDAAAGRCDRAEMQRLVRELERLEQQAAAVVQAIQVNPGAVLISLAQAQAQLRRVREFLAAARARPPRNCPPAGSTPTPTPPPGSPTPPPAPPTPPAPPATPPPPAPSPAPPPAPPQEFGGVGRELGEAGLVAAPEGVSRADPAPLPDRAGAAFARARAAAASCDRQGLATAVRQLGTLVVQARVERNRARGRGADASAAAARQRLDLVTERHAEARRLQRACRRSDGRGSE